jgi:hypothetical protein
MGFYFDTAPYSKLWLLPKCERYRVPARFACLNWSILTVSSGNLATTSSSPPSAFTIRRRVEICMSDCFINVVDAPKTPGQFSTSCLPPSRLFDYTGTFVL